jgi:hypothetical protein
MVSLGSKSDSTPSSSITEALEAIWGLQQNLQKIDTQLQQVEDETKSVAETHKLIDAKLDGLYRVMQQ